jgi:SAM-dependent methyltransferase
VSESPSGYIYDTSQDEERTRLRSLERNNDPATIEYLEGVGIAEGWHCLEVGGGGGSVTRWMCERVGSTGRVVATDLDTRFLDEIEAGNLEVRRHDIVEDDLERDSFDLVHSRFLLEHLPSYDGALRKMIDALKPGGWLVAEDVDIAAAIMADPEQRPGVPPASVEIGAELTGKMLAMSGARGLHTELGRRLPALLVDAGLQDVGAEGRTTLMWSTSEEAAVGRLTIDRMTSLAVTNGVMTEAERDRYLGLFTDPDVATFTPLRFGAWGRKPD